MRFHSVQPRSRSELERAFERGDENTLVHTILSAAYHDPEWKWVQEHRLRYLDHPSPSVRAIAVTCLGHLARIHRQLDVAIVMPRLVALRDSDTELAGQAEDAISDINTYIRSDHGERIALIVCMSFEGIAPSPIRDNPTAKPLRWKPAASLKPLPDEAVPLLAFGISEVGTWVVPSPNGEITDVESSNNFWPLFPLLDMPYERLRCTLKEEFARHGIDRMWNDEFPFSGIAAAALRSDSKFWPNGALEWASHMPISDELQSALAYLVEHGSTQTQRRRAQALLRD
jgi:hypothetical protein